MGFSSKIFFFISVLLCICFTRASAQLDCSFEHFGTEDGLPQNNIMNILQDKKGFMWFSTWDGLSKFDGYNFKTIRLPNSDKKKSKSNRIDHIHEDKYGNIWVQFYDNLAYRYNPQTGQFRDANALSEFGEKSFHTQKVIPKKSGKVWLLSDDNGTICIVDSTFNVETYNIQNNRLSSNNVHDVFEDHKLGSWILTDNGLLHVDNENNSEILLNKNSTNFPRMDYPAYCAMEWSDEIWFGSSEGKIWIYSFGEEKMRLMDTGMQASITKLHRISEEKIVAATPKNGFLVYDVFSHSWELFSTSNHKEMVSDIINTVYVDLTGNVWLETDRPGVSKFNSHTGKIIHFSPKIESMEANVFLPNFFIFEDINKRLWVHPRGGGFGYYDRVNNKLVPFYNEPFSKEWRFSNVLHSAYSDRQGNLWFGTRTRGLEKVTFFNSNFKTFHTSSEINSTTSNDVRPIFQDSGGRIWIGTKDGKIHVYDKEMNHSGYLSNKGQIGRNSHFKGISYCIMEDSKRNIWIGTKGEGVYKLTPAGDDSYNMVNFKNSTDDILSLSDNNIYSIFEDKHNRIWVGTYGGGLNYIQENDSSTTFINHRNRLKSFPIETASQVRIISSDKHGNIFVGSTLGLTVFSPDFETPDEIGFQNYHAQFNDFSLHANDIFDICTTQHGETYIATFGGGVSKVVETDKNGFPVRFKTYSTSDGLVSKVVLSIQEDYQNNLWICYESNISRFNPQTESFENFSEIKRLMNQQNFSEGSKILLSDGKILFGNSKGVLYFDSGELSNNTYNPYLALVGFKIFNREVPIDETGPLKFNIDDTQSLKLKYNQNFFTIEFAGLDYEEPDNISYAYKLEGFDKEWIYNNKLRTANYTNLTRGKYTFKVRSTNSNGIWSDNERHLAIEILPPLWKTWWAYLIYAALTILATFFSLRLFLTFYKIRQQAELEHREAELKTKFFTDISHEIRTPLTMIVSPVDNIIQDKDTPESIRKQLTLVSKNTGRLLTMVNQILDFRKIEKKTIEVGKIEIGAFVEDVCEGFVKLAEKESIDFIIQNSSSQQTIWADADALEKILVNLLSNAFKYTPANKAIRVSVSVDNDFATVKIEDQGRGISKEKMARLFKRFESFNEDESKPSTGIGLSIVKELMDKHSAKIFVESEPNVGTSFSLFFHTGTSHFKSDMTIEESGEIKRLKTHDKLEEISAEPDLHTPDDDGRPSILVVEDDDDLRGFIVSALEKEYDMVEARNGKEGLEKALQLIPDFIVSDIMMPEMDGMEFLHNIRANASTSHILFLLLTAKTTDDDIIGGYESGTDEYVTKPFSVSYLQARVKNLIRRRKNIQDFYRKSSRQDESTINIEEENITVPDSIINDQDREFVGQIADFIIDKMGDFEYVVEDIAAEMGMSRTVFYKKVKGLTGLSPIEFKRDILLQEAAKLLNTKEHTVKEVAFLVGFADAKYFTKCFKAKFDVTPSEFMKAGKRSFK